MEENQEPKIWASMSRTVNLGNYESLKLDMGVSGIPLAATKEQIKEIMDSADKTLTQVIYALAEDLSKKVEEATGGR